VIESTAAECEKLSGIVDNLLFVARADAARQEIKRTQFDGKAAIEKIVAYYQPFAEERNIAVVFAGEGNVFGDSVLFSRALTNVVDNALRFTPEGGTIKLAIAADTNQSRISVSDTGSGIAGEHIPRVFDRFYRADSSRSTSGTGLGLALVKSIMDLHGGSAQIESEVRRGTTVVLTFPNLP
jgi:two-component system heavy metal sensor histidine kinase CusS